MKISSYCVKVYFENSAVCYPYIMAADAVAAMKRALSYFEMELEVQRHGYVPVSVEIVK